MGVPPRLLNWGIKAAAFVHYLLFMIQSQDACNGLASLGGESNTGILPHVCHEILKSFERLRWKVMAKDGPQFPNGGSSSYAYEYLKQLTLATVSHPEIRQRVYEWMYEKSEKAGSRYCFFKSKTQSLNPVPLSPPSIQTMLPRVLYLLAIKAP